MAKKKIYIFFWIAWTVMALLAIPESEEASGGDRYTSGEWATLVNLSGKQRMLSQKMSKEALFFAAGIAAEANRMEMQKTMAVFERTLAGLRKGDQELGLRPAKGAGALKILAEVEDVWAQFKILIQGTADSGDVPVSNIAQLSRRLLGKIEGMVGLLEKEAEEEAGKKSTAVINLAGRMRMSSQKVAKEMLLVYVKVENKDNLNATVDGFEAALNALMHGREVPHGDELAVAVPLAEDKAIKAQLLKVKESWERLKPLTESITEENIRKMAPLNVELLKEADKAVAMFEAAQR